jgi:flavodoxin I
MGMVRDIVEARGGIIIGNWPTASYNFEASKGLADDDHFVGLGIDEDRQPELTEERVDAWVKQIYEEMCLAELED